MQKWSLFIIIFLLLSVLSAYAQEDLTLTIVTHDDFAVSEDVLRQFEDETGIRVRLLRSGDAGTMVNQSILSKSNPLGDVMYGIDNTFLTRGLDADLFVPYESPLLENVSEDFILDAEHRVTPIDYGDVCINYDVQYFADNNLAIPESLADLTDPQYRGLLVAQNPATSSPGLAFLLTTITAFGEEGDYIYLDFWRDLVTNEILITDDWGEAYFGQFTVGSGAAGDYPMVVSYASSPPAEVFFAESAPESAPTASIIADGTCFRQIEFAGILAGTEHLEAARQFIDFLLSVSFQEDIPLQMFVFPVNENAELPELFTTYAAVPENPVNMDIAMIDANRERWIEAWTETVLR